MGPSDRPALALRIQKKPLSYSRAACIIWWISFLTQAICWIGHPLGDLLDLDVVPAP